MDGVKPERVIRRTKLYERYLALREAEEADRLAQAERLIADPVAFTSEFATSVKHFSGYDNANEHFYGKRASHKPGPELKRTIDVILRLEAMDAIHTVDATDRLYLERKTASVIDVPAADLAFEYVDRELLVHRTTSPSHWEDGAINRGGLRLDAVLATLRERRPIIAELKTPGDMDPFFALIQVLTCAAHLATPGQYKRMRKWLKRGRFPEQSVPPRFDVYVLTVPGPTASHRYQAELQKAAERLAPLLLEQEDIARSIRRIAWLHLSPKGTQIHVNVRLAHEAPMSAKRA